MPPEPLLRSGLVMARSQGALSDMGAVGESGPARIGQISHAGPIEDSLVTALEIAGMNLWGTQVVMLSACEPERGKVLGQGVQGLQQAFLVAGAETVVMSLWKVDDATTLEWVEGYYQRLLQGQGRAHALRETMNAVRARHPHPHDWAPFILVGNGAPLRGLMLQGASGSW